ncbi:hypothetical protein Patl1_32180 [Pistacia atlantica]|uniref:Uncharacterized protein n=1 Tax=Pistacia atlantica TaxID=434234 RepID=A0ACC1AQC5_9ROSI|nr:hypothetical protein Patl1_32180 [Pistacia atlantica]
MESWFVGSFFVGLRANKRDEMTSATKVLSGIVASLRGALFGKEKTTICASEEETTVGVGGGVRRGDTTGSVVGWVAIGGIFKRETASGVFEGETIVEVGGGVVGWVTIGGIIEGETIGGVVKREIAGGVARRETTSGVVKGRLQERYGDVTMSNPVTTMVELLKGRTSGGVVKGETTVRVGGGVGRGETTGRVVGWVTIGGIFEGETISRVIKGEIAGGVARRETTGGVVKERLHMKLPEGGL